MSLERSYLIQNIDEKNPLDTSNSMNMLSNSIFSRVPEDFYSPEGSLEIFKRANPVPTQLSSQLSDISQTSYNFKSLQGLQGSQGSQGSQVSQDLIEEKISLPIKKSQYKIVIEPAEDSQSSKENFEPQVHKNRASTIYTNLSSDSSQAVSDNNYILEVLEESKQDNSVLEKVKQKPAISRPAASLRNSTFALTSRIFCVKCNLETYNEVSFQMKEMNFWRSVGFFFTAIQCCGEPRALSRYQDIVHSCKKCGTVLAKISTG